MENREILLEKLGWTITCESPLEIESHDGDTATGFAADIVIQELLENFEDYYEEK